MLASEEALLHNNLKCPGTKSNLQIRLGLTFLLPDLFLLSRRKPLNSNFIKFVKDSNMGRTGFTLFVNLHVCALSVNLPFLVHISIWVYLCRSLSRISEELNSYASIRVLKSSFLKYGLLTEIGFQTF